MPRSRSVRVLLEALQHNEGVVLLSDLARPDLQTVEIPFFDRLARLPSGLARLALKTGASIVAVACVRTLVCHYRAEFRPALRPVAPGSRDAAVATLTTRIAAEFEALIQASPGQWYAFGQIWFRAAECNCAHLRHS
ncbi:MAG: lysophospholipid acyltransferase family protein, partial [Chloroflexi bacterium]|nr:lysophospholipid acyltransferase family protein [Chloroflexota bacterium]